MVSQVILLPGGVMPAELAYADLIAALGDDVQAVAKELELYARSEPPSGYTLDTEVDFNLYSAVPSPVDDSIWGVSERFPGYLVRVDRGTNPPESCRAEVFRVPEPGFDPRGDPGDRTHGIGCPAITNVRAPPSSTTSPINQLIRPMNDATNAVCGRR